MTQAPYRILVVEDDQDDIVLLEHALSKVEALELETAQVGLVSDALQHVENEPTDIVLLDLALPDGSGLDIVARLKASSSHPSVIAMTSHSSEAMAVNALRAGVDNYISKPVTASELDIVVSDALERREGLG